MKINKNFYLIKNIFVNINISKNFLQWINTYIY